LGFLAPPVKEPFQQLSVGHPHERTSAIKRLDRPDGGTERFPDHTPNLLLLALLTVMCRIEVMLFKFSENFDTDFQLCPM
jgi:hypothetical protein